MKNTSATSDQKLKKISVKFVIEKFKSKNTNANQWIDIFLKQCTRFKIKKTTKNLKFTDCSWINLTQIDIALC